MYYSTLNSQRILTLLPTVQGKANEWIAELEKVGCHILITDAYRSYASQAWLYYVKRIRPCAPPGYSMHGYGCALDFAPADDQGHIVYTDKTRYYQAINIAKNLGFTSGSDWVGPKFDLPHLEYTLGHPIEYFRNGGRI